jgi:hypothetical protein
LSNTTDFETRCDIIHSYFWHRVDSKEEEYNSFNVDNFAGLVLACSYNLKLAEPTIEGTELVNTTFDNLLTLNYETTDRGWSSYEELINDIEF